MILLLSSVMLRLFVVFLQLAVFVPRIQAGTSSGANEIVSQQVPMSIRHLIVAEDGSVWGWGDNAYGQLGPDGGESWPKPRRVEALPAMVAVAAGGRHALALDREGQVWAWGDNSSGQLGLGHTKPSKAPTLVPGLANIKEVAAGIHHSLALSQDGTLWAWGSNSRGQLGFGPTGAFEVVVTPARIFALDGVGAVAVAAGRDFSLYLGRDGRVSTWGSGSHRAQPVIGPVGTVKIKAQGERAFALGKEGRAWRWISAPPASAVRVEESGIEAFRAFAADGRDEVMMVSGSVTSAGGKAVPGARILAGQTPCAESASSGRYFCVLPRNWRGSVQAVKAGVRFERSRAASAASAAKANTAPTTAPPIIAIDFIAAPPLLRITGRVLAIERDARVRVSGAGASCGPVKPSGQFSCTVPKGWHGTLSATRPGYVYPSRSYSSVGAALTDQNFAGQRAAGAKPAAVQAPVPVSSGATRPGVAVEPNSPQSAAPKAAEAERVARPDAARASPAQAPSPQDVHVAGTLFISGTADARSLTGARPIANATIGAEGAQCTNSDEAGNFVCTARAGWSGRIIPRKSNYRFTPRALAYSELRQDQRSQDFAAIYEPNQD